jgi:hypothetical protein
MSDSIYTWGGTYFGKRYGDSLFTHGGVEAGRFHGDEVYGADGAYLGEVKNGKLITNTSKRSKRQGSFTPRRRGGHVAYVGRVGTVMYVAHEDFPHPDTFA